VSEASQQELRAIWRQLARRNDWALVEDEAVFLEQVAAEYDALPAALAQSQRQRGAVQRAYGVLLYRGLSQRGQLAAGELWLAFVRTAVGRGWARADAEELAQEGIARVLENLPSLRKPQSFLSWAFKIFRTVRRDGAKLGKDEQPLDTDDQDAPSQRADTDTADVVAQVEQAVASQELLTLLRARLPNPLERLAVMRLVLFGHRPRIIADDLGLPSYRIRVAQCRALQRLRQDSEFMRLLEDLSGRARLQPATTGAHDHDT
jgi:RNA polymerase sigma factor (sigma-70 family)